MKGFLIDLNAFSLKSAATLVVATSRWPDGLDVGSRINNFDYEEETFYYTMITCPILSLLHFPVVVTRRCCPSVAGLQSLCPSVHDVYAACKWFVLISLQLLQLPNFS
jgi:hypothetical protein